MAATATAARRTYATSNGAAVTATTDAEWLTLAVSGDVVTFTPTAFSYDADGESPRTATVVITIADTSVTSSVTVSQVMAANE